MKKTIAVVVSLALGSSLVPINTFASETNNSVNRISNVSTTTGVPEISGKTISSTEVDNLSEVYLIDGTAYDKNGNRIVEPRSGGITTQGKLSWAAKAIKEAYNSFPQALKDKIGGQAKFLGAVAVLEHFTGSVEDGLTQGFQNMGFSEGVARGIAKSITFIAL